jgi:hypothetical protein
MNECCKEESNLVLIPKEDFQGEISKTARAPGFIVRGDVTIRGCRVCGCRHFEFVVDPGRLAMELRR